MLAWVVYQGLGQIRKWHLSWELKDWSLAKWSQVKKLDRGNSMFKGSEAWKSLVGLRHSQRPVCDWSMVNKGEIDMVEADPDPKVLGF